MAIGSNTIPAGIAKIDAASNPAVSSLKPDEANSKADSAGKRLADDFDEFMLMLTTQLQNQDPTEPMDTNQFTQQLVAFTGVEQSVQTNKNLEKLLSMTQNSQVNSAVGFIGKSVETDGVEAFLDKGQAEMSYVVPPGAAKVTLAVLDTTGKPLFTTDTPLSAGRQVYHWDGTNSFTGQKMKDGIYTFGVVARDAKGKTLETKTFATGKVTGISLGDEDLMLTLGGMIDVPLSKVISVREAAATPAATQVNNKTNTSNTQG